MSNVELNHTIKIIAHGHDFKSLLYDWIEKIILSIYIDRMIIAKFNSFSFSKIIMANKNNNICGGLYTSKVMETFKNPHNYGKIKNPSAVGEVGNIVCGDVMFLYIKVDKSKKNQEIIKEIIFPDGCKYIPRSCGYIPTMSHCVDAPVLQRRLSALILKPRWERPSE